MNNYHSRRILTLEESSRKRKDRDTFYSSTSSRPSIPSSTAVSNVSVMTSFSKAEPINNNSSQKMPNPVLAGYMAYEFLTKGTLLGQKFDPARAKAVPVNALGESKKRKPEPARFGKRKEPSQSYVEMASLLRSDGTHIPGIVNPTQLAQWIQM